MKQDGEKVLLYTNSSFSKKREKADLAKNVCMISNEMGVSWWERDSKKQVEGFDFIFKTDSSIFHLEMKALILRRWEAIFLSCVSQ